MCSLAQEFVVASGSLVMVQQEFLDFVLEACLVKLRRGNCPRIEVLVQWCTILDSIVQRGVFELVVLVGL